MKSIDHLFNNSVLLFIITLLAVTSISCGNPEKDFNKAKAENSIESLENFVNKYPESPYTEEAQKIIYDLAFNEAKAENSIEGLEGFMNKYPESHYVEDAQKIIYDMAFNEAKAENTIDAFEDYIAKYSKSGHIEEAKKGIMDLAFESALSKNTDIAYNDFIKEYNPPADYIAKINEQIKNKQKCLQLAIETHCLAQQETNDTKQKQLFAKSSELFDRANFKEAMMNMSGYPLLNLHLAEESSLKGVVDRPFTLTRYTYGSSEDEYGYVVKNEALNDYTLYNFVLASAGKTDFLVKVILKRGNKNIVICENSLSVKTKYYTGYSGLMKNKKIPLRKGDKIILKITATGDNFGTVCGNFKTYIKLLKPQKTLSDDVISERKSALDWIISNCKHKYPSSSLLAFIAEMDHCILENRDGEWSIGSGMMANDHPCAATWRNNKFTAGDLDPEKAKDLEKTSMQFKSNKKS
jgi:outer membrane protein assembly factor BamD (BamD/ComL family)